MLSHALYYPYIDFKDVNWIKSMSMFYDVIYRIVPDGLIPSDNEKLQPLLEDENIGKMIDPISYSANASEHFLAEIKNWDAAALCPSDGDIDLSRIHEDKTDEKVKNLFKELGYKETEGWSYVPTELASNYMLYLATEISIKNRLCLLTNEWAPWTATTYFNLNGNIDEFMMAYESDSKYIEDPYALYSLIISEISPINISEIPSEAIIKFREKRKDEISLFRKHIYKLFLELQSVEDPVVRYDRIIECIKKLEQAKNDYKKSADIIKTKGWIGFSFLGFPAPLSLGQLFNIPFASTVALAAAGIAIGGLFNIKNTKEELRKLQKENPASFLVNVHRDFKKYTSLEVGAMPITMHIIVWKSM